STEDAVKSVVQGIARRIKLYAPPYPGAKMGSIDPKEFATEAQMIGLQIADLSGFYTNDLINDINAFDPEKIRAEALVYK
ncbi:hypothetical protein, partial [Stenotrophomonas maltophilia]|uniref:hypothetical protein n=1 Tax=Stenotrophomonas maltophilia TaxID=40324 RepID=UPI001952D8FE